MANETTDTSAFDRRRHYLLCDRCGAPVEVGWEATTTACVHCQAPIEVRLRPEAAAKVSARDESERRGLLATQDRNYVPPNDIAHLFAGERIAPSLESEARRIWQQHRAALRAGDRSGAEAFFFLTSGLAELSGERGDLSTQRGVVDSALALLESSDHVQVLRTQLARSALRAGDPTAAESWLSACDPASDQLLADTAYRFARAYVDTYRGDWQAVIRTLGSGGDVPFSEAFASECCVLCANAWERLEQPSVAVDALVSAKRDLGPIAQRRIVRFTRDHAAWDLCPKSGAEADRRVASMDTVPAEGGIVGGLIMTCMGLVSLLWLVSGLVGPFLIDPDEFTGGDLLGSICVGGLLAVLLTPIGILSIVRTRREYRQRARGTAYAARVLGCEVLSNEEWSTQVRLSLLITPDDAPAYHSTIETGLLRAMIGNVQPGRVLIARMGKSQHDYALEIV